MTNPNGDKGRPVLWVCDQCKRALEHCGCLNKRSTPKPESVKGEAREWFALVDKRNKITTSFDTQKELDEYFNRHYIWNDDFRRKVHVIEYSALEAERARANKLTVELEEERSQNNFNREMKVYWHDEFWRSAKERDEARAEVERLKHCLDKVAPAYDELATKQKDWHVKLQFERQKRESAEAQVKALIDKLEPSEDTFESALGEIAYLKDVEQIVGKQALAQKGTR